MSVIGRKLLEKVNLTQAASLVHQDFVFNQTSRVVSPEDGRRFFPEKTEKVSLATCELVCVALEVHRPARMLVSFIQEKIQLVRCYIKLRLEHKNGLLQCCRWSRRKKGSEMLEIYGSLENRKRERNRDSQKAKLGGDRLENNSRNYMRIISR